jgi:hypothetical protein
MDERWNEQKRQRDLDDLNNEAAGREVGRISRFHHERDPKTIEDKKQERERRLSALAQLMRDPEYAAAYQRANDAIDRAQAALDTALLENAQITEELQDRLDEMEARAARLPDGRAVFRSAGGSLRTTDGHRLRSEAIPATLILPLDAASYEDYAATRDALTSARAHGQELSRVQTEVIDPARDRMADQDNPPSREELEEIEREMDATLAIIQGQHEPSSSSEHNVEADIVLELDDLEPSSSTIPSP